MILTLLFRKIIKNFVIKRILVVILYTLYIRSLYIIIQKFSKIFVNIFQLQRTIFWERKEKINLQILQSTLNKKIKTSLIYIYKITCAIYFDRLLSDREILDEDNIRDK